MKHPLQLTPWLLLALAAHAASAQPRLTHGVAVGDVTARSAVVWGRSDVPAEMVVELTAEGAPTHRASAPASPTAQVAVDGLEPATRYSYRVVLRAGNEVSEPREGSFTTAPDASVVAPVRFLVGGDVGGQGYCRHPEDGYPIFRVMAELEPDFFIANGDMIYADNACPPMGPGGPNLPGDFPGVSDPAVDWTDLGAVRGVIDAHWSYNRAGPHVRAFHERVPVYVQWDDHEVVNDFGAAWPTWPKADRRAGYPTLVRAGWEALFDWNPIASPPGEKRLYRSFRWGKDVELFLLDARSYRDRNELPDRPGKTMLGLAQRRWLVEEVKASDATWKVVSSDVPLSIPTGSEADLYGRDAFANGDRWDADTYGERTGFESELLAILEAWDAADVRNVVFVVTDVHFAMSLRYVVDLDGDGDTLVFHELLNGPLHAVRLTTPPQLDPTLRPVILYAEGDLFNFSSIEVKRDASGTPVLEATIRGADGAVRFGSRLELRAEPERP